MSSDPQGVAPVLEARRLRKAFGRLDVLKGIDLDLDAARITVLLGANGAGKSTLMRLLAGDLLPDQGAVRIRGVDLATHPATARRGLVHVSQSPPLAPFLTTREHAEAMIAFRSLARDAAMANLEQVAARLGLRDQLDRPTRVLSGGMQQKAALSLALASEVPLVLLDEPHAGLDIPSAIALRELMMQRRASATAFLVASHLAEASLAIADRAVVLARGNMVLDLDAPALATFGGDARRFEAHVLEAMAAPTAEGEPG